MKPIDMLGLGPKREAIQNKTGWLVTVTSGFGTNSVQLTEDQYIRYLDWHIRDGLIHNCLPDLSPAEREILITGIGDQNWLSDEER